MSEESSKKFLILGAGGQLGQELVSQLGEEAIAKPREALDITNFASVQKSVSLIRPSVVVNCAAVSSEQLAISDPAKTWRVNAAAVDNLVKGCALSGVPLLHISCDSVFGVDYQRREPFTETDAVGTLSPLGTSKIMGEQAILRLAQCMCPEFWGAGFRYWIVRTGTLYGCTNHVPANWLGSLLSAAAARRKEPLHVPSDVIRSFTYIPHLAQALVWFVRHYQELVSGIYHIADAGQCSTYDLLAALAMSMRKPIKPTPVLLETMANQAAVPPQLVSRRAGLRCAKFADVYPGRLPTWQQGIEEFAAEYDNS